MKNGKRLLEGIKKSIENNFYILRLVWNVSKLRFAVKTIITFISAILPIINILIIKNVVLVLEQHHTDDGKALFGIFRLMILFCIIQIVIKSFDIWIVSYTDPILATQINKKINLLFLEKIKKFEYACFEDSTFLDRYVRAVNQVDTITHRVFASFFGLFSSLIGIILITSLIISMDWFVVTFVVFCVAVNFVQSLLSSRINFDASQASTPYNRQQHYLKRIFLLPDYAKDFQTYDIISTGSKYYIAANEKIKGIVKKYGRNKAIISNLGSTLSIICSTCQILFLISKVLRRIYSIAEFSALTTASSQLEATLNSCFNNITLFYQNSMEINNLRYILDYQQPKCVNNGKICHETDAYIQIQHLSFSYPKSCDQVINDISFSIKQGEKIALVGMNGSGKTTLVKLLLGLYKPSSGDILINGKSISMYTRDELRKIMGVAFQDNHIFAYTFSENIAFSENISRYGEQSLDLLEMRPFISSLPNGLDTLLSKEFDSSGINISGGEAQKISITRALNTNASILVFDEPSSSLDPISEQKINSVIFGLAKKTVLLISHRLSTSTMADRIILLDKGKIVEEGSHEELMRNNGMYAKMFSVQANPYTPSP